MNKNNENQSLFYREFIFFNVSANDKNELLKKVSTKLYEYGYVKESFIDAIQERENKYPTGLPTKGVKVSIPHTDPIHVIKPIITVVNLNNPIIFKEMGNGENDIYAELIFLLAIADPNKQIDILKKLMDIFMNEAVLKEIKNASTEEDTIKILEREIYSK